MSTLQLSDKTALVDGPFGLGVVCTAPIADGEFLFPVIGRWVDRPDRYSVQVGDRMHLTPDGAAWSLVNHACRPNVAIDFQGWGLYAITSIAVGTQLGWNYLTTEWQLSCPFRCGCGAVDCAGVIRGFKYAPPQLRERLRPWLSPFLATRCGASSSRDVRRAG